jgi:hypothetical protein
MAKFLWFWSRFYFLTISATRIFTTGLVNLLKVTVSLEIIFIVGKVSYKQLKLKEKQKQIQDQLYEYEAPFVSIMTLKFKWIHNTE